MPGGRRLAEESISGHTILETDEDEAETGERRAPGGETEIEVLRLTLMREGGKKGWKRHPCGRGRVADSR